VLLTRSSIPVGLLDGQDGIESITVNPGITSVQPGAFNNINVAMQGFGLTVHVRIVFAYGWISINPGLFASNQITEITIPQSVTNIAGSAFNTASALRTVNFVGTSRLTTIGNSAFSSATALSQITLPSSVNSIGSNAFPTTTRVDWNGRFAFRGNQVVAALASTPNSLTIPQQAMSGRNITSIAVGAFNNTRFTRINIPSTVTRLEYSITFAANTYVQWQDNISFRGSEFSRLWCMTRTTFAVPSAIAGRQITSIAASAFAFSANIVTLTIPSTIATIGSQAFVGMTGLRTIHNQRATPQTLVANAFQAVNRGLITVVVPNGTRRAFENAGWTGFAAIDDGTSTCVVTGTLITLADGSQVAVEELTGNESLLVWDFRTGEFTTAPILFVDHGGTANYRVVRLSFANGEEVKIIDSHGFFSICQNRFVRITTDNASEFVGQYFLSHSSGVENNSTGGRIDGRRNDRINTRRSGNVDSGLICDFGGMRQTQKRLASVEVFYYTTEAWNPIVANHFSFFANGVLSAPGAFVRVGFLNIFDIDSEMLSVCEANYAYLIGQFGLLSLEEFRQMCYSLENFCPQMFIFFNGKYLRVAVYGGTMSWEGLLELIGGFRYYL